MILHVHSVTKNLQIANNYYANGKNVTKAIKHRDGSVIFGLGINVDTLEK